MDGRVAQAKRVQDKQALLAKLAEEDLLMAAWTGNYTTDIFVLDDRGAVREAFR